MLKAIRKASVSREQSAAHARRIADTASARHWLAEGAPIADVLTMLEVHHRFEFSLHFARAYAVGIISAARAELLHNNRIQSTYRKEQFHAVA
jgi:hypothetical protein